MHFAGHEDIGIDQIGIDSGQRSGSFRGCGILRHRNALIQLVDLQRKRTVFHYAVGLRAKRRAAPPLAQRSIPAASSWEFPSARSA